VFNKWGGELWGPPTKLTRDGLRPCSTQGGGSNVPAGQVDDKALLNKQFKSKERQRRNREKF